MDPKYVKFNIIIGVIGALTGIISAWIAVKTFLNPSPPIPIIPATSNTAITSNTSVTSNTSSTSNTAVTSNTFNTLNSPDKIPQPAAIERVHTTTAKVQGEGQQQASNSNTSIPSRIGGTDPQCNHANPPIACLFEEKNK